MSKKFYTPGFRFDELEWSDDLVAVAVERTARKERQRAERKERLKREREENRRKKNRRKKTLRRVRREMEREAVLNMLGDRMRAGQIATAKALQESLALERAYIDAIGKAMDKKRAKEDAEMAALRDRLAKATAAVNRDLVRTERQALTQRGLVRGRRK